MGRLVFASAVMLALACSAAAPRALGEAAQSPQTESAESAGATSGEELTGRQRFVMIVAGLLVAVGAAGALVVRRGRRARGGAVSREAGRQAEAIGSARPEVQGEARTKICPTCGERYESDSLRCAADGTKLVALN